MGAVGIGIAAVVVAMSPLPLPLFVVVVEASVDSCGLLPLSILLLSVQLS